eukprot:gene6385-351_t
MRRLGNVVRIPVGMCLANFGRWYSTQEVLSSISAETNNVLSPELCHYASKLDTFYTSLV